MFVYDVPNKSWRFVTGLPKGLVYDVPSLSDDGRWLGFTSSRHIPSGVFLSFPALLDLETGELTDSVGGIEDWTSFDSVITRDAKSIVISSEADLDPRVGNADHNMELFVYDRATGQFTQVTETTGGIGTHPGNCESYRPSVSDDAHAMVFRFNPGPYSNCRIDAPQRSRSTA